MNDLSPVRKILDSYKCNTNAEKSAALREIIQELALIGLSRTDFFTQAAFYGGTALRIFHGLDRFSEALDFSLIKPDQGFLLDNYFTAIKMELASWGFDMHVERKEKVQKSTIQSAFIKGGTLVHLVKIAAITPPVSGIPENAVMNIKLEIDTDPPAGATYETKYRLNPVPYAVRLFTKPSLFAGKVHALLCRKWKERVKGRDFYDYLWYLSEGVPLNLNHLEARMRQSGHWGAEQLNEPKLRELLNERFMSVDFARAKADAIPFLRDSRVVELWSSDFFISLTREHLTIVL
ncbi:MAG: nucleotidyl transferase AbiEii/AbiGii toxin family protein [Spirochaetes bacterium]|nr:nucleotidyl transferase AbiEii/AbiGii toxin family protein [Spirochaetota bacterium]